MKDKALLRMLSTMEQKIQSSEGHKLEDLCLRAESSHPCYVLLAGTLTIVSSDMLSWLPHKVIFNMSHKLFLGCPGYRHCGFHEHRGNSWQIPRTRKLKTSQWWKMDWVLVEGMWTVDLKAKITISLASHWGKKLVLSFGCHCWYSIWFYL